MTLAGFIMACFIGSFFVVGILSSRMDRQHRENEQKIRLEKQAAEEKRRQDEILFLESINALLPDLDAALIHLVGHFGWSQVVGTIGLNKLHFDVLYMANPAGQVALPNMQAVHYGTDERRVAREVRRVTNEFDDVGFYGPDAYTQEPTMQMLRDLVNWGYVITAEPITEDSRVVQCELTPEGASLLNLNKRFRRTPLILHRVLSSEEEKTLRDVLRMKINSRELTGLV